MERGKRDWRHRGKLYSTTGHESNENFAHSGGVICHENKPHTNNNILY